MNVRPITELTLYKYRYIISYVLLVAVIALALLLNFANLPPGLAAGEEKSVLASNALRLDLSTNNPLQSIVTFLQKGNMVDLLYHSLQKGSLEMFGLSPLGVRLPSVILAATSAFMIFALLRRWLFASPAIIMGTLIVISSWFLTIGRLGTPDVMMLFWPSLLLLLATLVSQEAKAAHLWKAIGLLSVALSLYTPAMIYLYIAAFLAGLAQPHLRYVVRYAQKTSLAIGIFLLLIILTPLGYHIWRDPGVIQQLLAIPTPLPDALGFFSNTISTLSTLLNPFNIHFDAFLTPLICLPLAVLAIIGLIRLIIDWHSVRSHVLLVWVAILVPIMGLNGTTMVNLLFLPSILLGAIGMQTLIRYWYRLFPRNPYARIFGLLPLGLLFISIAHFNYQRYFIALPYTPNTVNVYNQDSFILHQALASKSYREQRILLVVPTKSQEFFAIEKSTAKNLEVTSAQNFNNTVNASSVIVAENELPALSEQQRAALPKGKVELLVNDRKDNALRYRIYSQ